MLGSTKNIVYHTPHQFLWSESGLRMTLQMFAQVQMAQVTHKNKRLHAAITQANKTKNARKTML